MDFTNTQFEGTSSNNNYTNGENTLQSSNLISAEEKVSIALSNVDLIEKCLATKSNKFLSKGELKNYGMVALRTAALDAEEEDNFRIFALKRIEFMMNRAIAEAHLIFENKNNICDNSKLGNGFNAIHNTYCYQ